MDGIKENTLPDKSSPTNDYKVRALDDQGKSVVIPFSVFNQIQDPVEGDIKDFLEGSTIRKKRYTSGAWIETGIEWEI